VAPALIVAAVVSILWPRLAAGAGVAAPQHALRWLVAPLDVEAASTRTYWMGEGVAVLLSDRLESLGLEVVSREDRTDVLEWLRLPAGVPLSRASYLRAAGLLGASSVVFGSVRAGDDRVEIRLRRVDAEQGRHGADMAEEGPLLELPALADRAARRLAQDAGIAVPAGPAAAPAGSLEAFEAYVKALLTDRPQARVELLRLAVEKAPGDLRARLALAETFLEMGDHEAALAAAAQVPDGAPLAPRARFLAARALIELGRLDQAFARLRALADARADAAVLNNLGVVQLRRGSPAETGRATWYLTRAVEAEGRDADTLFNLGYAYWTAERDARAAIYWLREALRLNPADPETHIVLAAALEATGAHVEAARERALAGLLAARYENWDTRAAGDRVPRGLERLKDHLATDPARRFPPRGPSAAWSEVSTAAASGNPAEIAAFHLERARRFLEQQRDGDAEPELRRVLFLLPYHADAHRLLGEICHRTGRLPEAAAAFRISLWSEETTAAHVGLGEVLADMQQWEAARLEARRALTLDPGSPEARRLLERIEGQKPR
jgi:Flp pilus assembly protein TadD/TolB-like protein